MSVRLSVRLVSWPWNTNRNIEIFMDIINVTSVMLYTMVVLFEHYHYNVITLNELDRISSHNGMKQFKLKVVPLSNFLFN